MNTFNYSNYVSFIPAYINNIQFTDAIMFHPFATNRLFHFCPIFFHDQLHSVTFLFWLFKFATNLCCTMCIKKIALR